MTRCSDQAGDKTQGNEFINGKVFARSENTANHNRIMGNVYSLLSEHLEGSKHETFKQNMQLAVNGNTYYPDVLVDCDFDESEPYFTKTPVIIVEVISRSTRKMDEKTKLIEYINIPSLQEYVTIEQDVADITVYRRSDDWRSTHYFLGEEITFESIDFTVAVEEIYARVRNEDVELYIQQEKQG